MGPARTGTERQRLDVSQPLPELLAAAKGRAETVTADRNDLDGRELAEDRRVAIIARLLELAFQPQGHPVRQGRVALQIERVAWPLGVRPRRQQREARLHREGLEGAGQRA